MIHSKSSFVFLIGILLYTCRIKGQPSINLPSGNTGNYNEPTEMNCTDTSFDISKGYTWSKDSIKVYDNINGDATGTGKYTSSHGTEYFTLVITNTLLNDSGVYRCFHNFNDASGTLNIQAKGTGVGEWKDGQLVVTLTEFYPSSTTVTSVLCKSNVLTGNSTTTAEGEFFKIVWTSTNAQSVDLTDGCDITIESHTTYRIHIDVEATTTGDGCDAGCIAGICVGVAFLLFIIGCIVGCVKAALVEDEDNFKWILLSCIIIVGLGILTVMGIRRCLNKCTRKTTEKTETKHETHGGNSRSNRTRPSMKMEDELNEHGLKKRPQPPPPGTNLHGRPMPAITPGHDSKGRGLSANFDDKDHPLEYIETPAQRKGALGALDEGTGEESQKVKKKKKKSNKNRDLNVDEE